MATGPSDQGPSGRTPTRGLGISMGRGLALGTGLGIAFGAALGNLAIGILIGMGAGMALGVAYASTGGGSPPRGSASVEGNQPFGSRECVMSNANQLGDNEPVPALLQQGDVVGVSRLSIHPAFIGRTICTLVYLPAAVRISIVDAREIGQIPFRGTVTRPLESLRRFGPLASWRLLRAAAFAAPSCSSPNVLDGISYRHVALDWDGGIEATWSNPGLWPDHRTQCELVDAYQSLLESGLLLQPGTAVRIRAGVLFGCVGRVDQLERHKNRVRVMVEMAGSRVAVELAASELEFASDSERGAAPDRAGVK